MAVFNELWAWAPGMRSGVVAPDLDVSRVGHVEPSRAHRPSHETPRATFEDARPA